MGFLLYSAEYKNIIFLLCSLFILIFKFTQIWPVGAKRETFPKGSNRENRLKRVHHWWTAVLPKAEGTSMQGIGGRMVAGRRGDSSALNSWKRRKRNRWRSSWSWDVCDDLYLWGKKEVKWSAHWQEAVGGQDAKGQWRFAWQPLGEWRSRWLATHSEISSPCRNRIVRAAQGIELSRSVRSVQPSCKNNCTVHSWNRWNRSMEGTGEWNFLNSAIRAMGLYHLLWLEKK